MLNFIKNLFAPKPDPIEKPDYLLSLSRSPQWYKVRTEFIKTNNKCVACGMTTNLEVHHMVPVHVAPSLELDPNNLITLCENKSIACHFVIGHSFDWKAYNPNVMEDARRLRYRRDTRSYK